MFNLFRKKRSVNSNAQSISEPQVQPESLSLQLELDYSVSQQKKYFTEIKDAENIFQAKKSDEKLSDIDSDTTEDLSEYKCDSKCQKNICNDSQKQDDDNVGTKEHDKQRILCLYLQFETLSVNKYLIIYT